MPQVQITCDTPESSIYYTVNGIDPTTSDNLYSSPFTVNSGVNIKAIGIKSGYSNSDVASYTHIDKLVISLDVARDHWFFIYIKEILYFSNYKLFEGQGPERGTSYVRDPSFF